MKSEFIMHLYDIRRKQLPMKVGRRFFPAIETQKLEVSEQVALGTKCKCGESCAAGTLVFGRVIFIFVAQESWDLKIGE